jgi:hypothetical protein
LIKKEEIKQKEKKCKIITNFRKGKHIVEEIKSNHGSAVKSVYLVEI